MNTFDYQLQLNWDETWHMGHSHFHEDMEILLSLSGNGEFFIENKLYPIQYGSLFILKAATIHKSVLEEKYKRYVFHISPDSLQKLSTSQTNFVELVEHSSICTVLSAKQTEDLVYKMYLLEQPASSELGGDLIKFTYLLDFLVTVFRLADRVDTNAKVVNLSFSKIEPIIEYIQKNLDEPLTLDSLSSRFYINKYHLCNVFKAATGFTVMEYVINCRIQRARELLRKGYRVQDVGEMVGFRNNSHFIRTFGALTGTSPKKYANDYKKGAESPVYSESKITTANTISGMAPV